MSLPAHEQGAAGVLFQLTPRCSFSQAGLHVQASASKTMPETAFQGKIKPILLAFQWELLPSQACPAPWRAQTWWAGEVVQAPWWMVEGSASCASSWLSQPWTWAGFHSFVLSHFSLFLLVA